ncbi:hypothetical protein G7009_12700 [Pseudomonas capeferrum]|uniref:hypothetical protein n=1 Tax=Pseudomonas capeferrum TaxID=1495066 RepID=UPI0015E32833|nr:hypothetical protein [Pseudomonas capeferrum]MBA1202603.1 hypothetical protein [Pseudomonas capeferrum]
MGGSLARSEQIDYREVSLNSQAEAIDQHDCELLCSGSLKDYQKLQPLCRTLGATLTYLGSDCGATLEG